MSNLARDHKNSAMIKIHIAKKQLNLTDEDYRAILISKGGVDSSKLLDHAGRERVLAYFQTLGFKPKAAPPGGWQAKKIEDLWEKLGQVPGALKDPSRAGLLAFVQHQAGVAELRFLDTRKAIKTTEALKAWLKRVSSK